MIPTEPPCPQKYCPNTMHINQCKASQHHARRIQYILGGHWMAEVNEPVTSQLTKSIRKSIKLRKSGVASAVTARNIHRTRQRHTGSRRRTTIGV